MPSIWRLVMVAMIERDNTTWPEGLPKELEDFFYEVKFVEVEAPGVYSIIARMHPDRLLTDEFYVVDRSSTIISDAQRNTVMHCLKFRSSCYFPMTRRWRISNHSV